MRVGRTAVACACFVGVIGVIAATACLVRMTTWNGACRALGISRQGPTTWYEPRGGPLRLMVTHSDQDGARKVVTIQGYLPAMDQSFVYTSVDSDGDGIGENIVMTVGSGEQLSRLHNEFSYCQFDDDDDGRMDRQGISVPRADGAGAWQYMDGDGDGVFEKQVERVLEGARESAQGVGAEDWN